MGDPDRFLCAPRSSRWRARRLFGTALVLSLVAFLSAGWATAAVFFPTGPWPQSQGDPGHAGMASGGPQPPFTQAWQFPVAPYKEQGASAPVIAGDLAITEGAKALYGVNLETGAEEWSVPRNGPPATPAVAESGRAALVLFTDGSDAKTSTLRAVDLETQREAWDSPASLKAVSRTGVTVEGSHAFVGDADGNVYAVNVASGRITWSSSVGGEPKGPLAVADGRVFAVPLSHDLNSPITATLVALDESDKGRRVWSYAPQPPSPISSLPAVTNGTVVVVTPGPLGDASVRGISTRDGSVVWSVRINAAVSPYVGPALASGAVYAADISGGLHRIDVPTGAQRWQFQYNEQVLHASPVVLDGHVVLGLGDGSVGVVDAQTGHLVWQSPAGPGSIGSIAVSPDLLVAVRSGDRGGLIAFKHDGAGTLVDVASPTVPRYGQIIGRFALAFVGVGVLVLGPLRLVSLRVGPADLSGEEEESPDGKGKEGGEDDDRDGDDDATS